MKHICGQCQKGFDKEKDYLDHVCEVTGVTPKDPENLGAGFVAVSEAAVARGKERVKLEKEGKTPEEAIKATRDIGKVIK